MTAVPAQIIELLNGWTNEFSRKISAASGETEYFWIRFDSPQNDADGDGPYYEAEIDSRFIEPV